MIKLKPSLPVLTVIVLSGIYVTFFYGKIVNHPNAYCFGNDGDGLKNYYTFIYDIEDSSTVNFTGMNYPYGESFLFTDGHPIFSILFKPFQNLFPSLNTYWIGILNFIMIFSIFLTPIILYLILKEFKVSKYFAAFCAIGIAMLTPQLQRLGGHYALSYSCAIPISWYLFILFSKKNNSLILSILISLNGLFWLLIHAYLGMMIIGFSLCMLLLNVILNKNIWKYFFAILIQILTPIVSFLIIARLSDTHTGRTTNPWGFLVDCSSIYNIIFPNIGSLKDFLNQYLNYTQYQPWESNAYIGMASLLIFIIVGGVLVLKAFKLKNIVYNSIFNNSNKIILISLVSSIIVLFISFSVPFRYNMAFMADWIPIIKQFRVLGRFAWVFYFVATVFSVWCFDVIAKNFLIKHKALSYFIWLIIPLVYISEGYAQNKFMSKSMVQTPNIFVKSNLNNDLQEALNNIIPNKYQAILPLPYFHKGSDNYVVIDKGDIWGKSALISYHSHLPICGAYLTRVSILESKNCVQIVSPNYYQKLIKSDIKSSKPFLIVCTKQPLKWYEQDILNKAKLIYTSDEINLYELLPDSLFTNTAKTEIIKFEDIRKNLKLKQNFLIADTSTFFYYNGFENDKTSLSFRGNGALTGNKMDYIKICDFPKNSFQKDSLYLASFWIYNCGDNYGQDMLTSLVIVQTENENKEIKWINANGAENASIINNCWSYIEIPFSVNDSLAKVSVLIKGNDNSKLKTYIDDVLVKPDNVDIYKVMKEDNKTITELFKNNQKIVVE